MIYCKNGVISMYQGDTGTLDVELIGDTRPTDRLEFRIKENIDDSNTLYTQSDSDITDNKFTININSTATAVLTNDTDVDKEYFYGFKLYRDDEKIDTIIAIGKIIVRKAV